MKLICSWCGDEFTRPNERGTIPKFCRPSHRQRAFEHRRDSIDLTALGPLTGSHVLVIRGDFDDADQAFLADMLVGAMADSLAAQGCEGSVDGKIPLIVWIPDPSTSIEALDEDVMREAGWVREERGTS